MGILDILWDQIKGEFFHFLSAYVKKHRHLHEIPSKNEVIEKSFDIGEMNKFLVAKVKELILY